MVEIFDLVGEYKGYLSLHDDFGEEREPSVNRKGQAFLTLNPMENVDDDAEDEIDNSGVISVDLSKGTPPSYLYEMSSHLEWESVSLPQTSVSYDRVSLTGLATDGEDQIWTCDSENNRIIICK